MTMMNRVVKLTVRGQSKDGAKSYAIPLTKSDLAVLDLKPGEQEIVLSDGDKVLHGLTVQSKSWHDYSQKHSSLDALFDDFWKEHPEIKDHDAYLKKYWDDRRKESNNGNLEVW